MGLTPHEERQIHEIEASLLDSDPGFAQRMNRLLRPRRKLMALAVCLLAGGVALGVSRPDNPVVSVACTAVVAFLAGWCFGRMGTLDPRTWPRCARNATRRGARVVLKPVRTVVRSRRRLVQLLLQLLLGVPRLLAQLPRAALQRLQRRRDQ